MVKERLHIDSLFWVLLSTRGVSFLLLGIVVLSVFMGCQEMRDEPASGLRTTSSSSRMSIRSAAPSGVRTMRTSGVSSPSDIDRMYVTVSKGTVGSESLVFQNQLFFWNGYNFLGEQDWPSQGPQYRFYASSVPTEFRSGGTVLWADGTSDVVCAYSGNPTWGAINVMSFAHIFGCIGTVSLSAEPGWSISAVSVTIEAVTGGTYDIRSGDGHTDRTGWSELVTESGYAINPPAPGTRSLNAYLVPGTYQVTASWTATAGAVSQSYEDLSARITVRAGESVDVLITLGGRLAFTTTAREWNEQVNLSHEL